MLKLLASLGGALTDDDVRSGTFSSKEFAIVQISLNHSDAGIDFLYFLSAFLTAHEYSVAVFGVFGDQLGQDIPANIPAGAGAARLINTCMLQRRQDSSHKYSLHFEMSRYSIEE